GGNRLAEIYDPATGTFKSAGQTKVNHGNSVRAVLLNDGRVLIEGGVGTANGAEIYDPVSGQFTVTGAMNQTHADFHSATLLQDGRVLVVGGLAAVNRDPANNSRNSGAEIYDPRTGLFTNAGAMTVNRRGHIAA